MDPVRLKEIFILIAMLLILFGIVVLMVLIAQPTISEADLIETWQAESETWAAGEFANATVFAQQTETKIAIEAYETMVAQTPVTQTAVAQTITP